MVEINLLNSRYGEQEKKAHIFRKVFFLWVSSSLVFLSFSHIGLIYWTNKLSDSALYWQKKLLEIKPQSQQIKKMNEQRLRRQEAVNWFDHVQRSQVQSISFFEYLLKKTPRDISLTQLLRQGQTMVIKGHSRSAVALEQFLKNLTESKWVRDVKMQKINNQSLGDVFFQIQAMQSMVFVE